MSDSNVKKTSPALIALAWIIVVAPTLWGFSYTFQNAKKIFTPNTVVAAPAAPAPPAAK